MDQVAPWEPRQMAKVPFTISTSDRPRPVLQHPPHREAYYDEPMQKQVDVGAGQGRDASTRRVQQWMHATSPVDSVHSSVDSFNYADQPFAPSPLSTRDVLYQNAAASPATTVDSPSFNYCNRTIPPYSSPASIQTKQFATGYFTPPDSARRPSIKDGLYQNAVPAASTNDHVDFQSYQPYPYPAEIAVISPPRPSFPPIDVVTSRPPPPPAEPRRSFGKRFKQALADFFKKNPVDEDALEYIENRHWTEE